MSLALVVVACLVALADWWSVWFQRPTVEAAAKTAVPALLIAAVASGEAFSGEARTDAGVAVAGMVMVALAAGLVGDVMLLPQLNRFIAGLGSFLVTNALLVAAFLTAGWDPGPAAAPLMGAALVAGAWIGARIVRAARALGGRGLLPRAVTAYVAVQTVMAVTGIATGSWTAGLGAGVLASSDAVLGWNRFVGPLPRGRVLTHVLYHTALVLLAVWAAG